MTSRDFVYWLQGLFELAEPKTLNTKQTELIRKHLAMVFIHEIDPSMGDEVHQGKLNSIHNPGELESNTLTTAPHLESVKPQLPTRPQFLHLNPGLKLDLTARC